MSNEVRPRHQAVTDLPESEKVGGGDHNYGMGGMMGGMM